MGLGRQQRGRNDAGIVGGCWVAELEYGEGADAPCPVASRPGGHVVDGEPAMSRFIESRVAEDECTLAWVVDGRGGVDLARSKSTAAASPVSTAVALLLDLRRRHHHRCWSTLGATAARCLLHSPLLSPESPPLQPRSEPAPPRQSYLRPWFIWISNDGDGTYAYDISRRAWAKHAEWALPFSGRAEYVSEHKLWFGLARNSTGNPMCACDLAAAAEQGSPPVQRNIWQQDVRPRKGWVPRYSNLLHLGSARFCIVRIFAKPSPETEYQSEWDGPKREEVFAVLTAVEVVRSGELGKGLRMVKHKSVRYSLGDGYCKVQPLMVY
uniref:Uncharacterized protein n=1 Tax=Oryza glumipatula TaxID=40148 RepID=A0A0D9Z4H8_9ORYZ